MATPGVRVVVHYANVKDVAKFKEAVKECIEATRKGT